MKARKNRRKKDRSDATFDSFQAEPVRGRAMLDSRYDEIKCRRVAFFSA